MKSSGVFDFKIKEERERFLNSEPCKLLRSIYKDRIEKRWGEIIEWKAGFYCDCEKACSRKKFINAEARKKAR